METAGAVSVMPKPSWNGSPLPWKNSSTGSGHGAPPETASSRAERSWRSKSGTAVRAAHIAGTMNCTVARSRAIASSVCAGSNDGSSRLVPPTYSSGSVWTPRPPMWNIGATVTVTSDSRSPRPKDRVFTTFHRWLSWVSMAPLGRPVVPDVVHQAGEVAAVDVGAERAGVTAGKQLLELRLTVGRFAADDDPGADPHALADQRGTGDRCQGSRVDEQVGAGVGEQVGDLGRGQAQVHGHEHRPELGRGQHRLQEGGAVEEQPGHPVAAAYSFRAEGPGQLVGAAVELRVGDAAFAGDERRPVAGEERPPRRPTADALVHRCLLALLAVP